MNNMILYAYMSVRFLLLLLIMSLSFSITYLTISVSGFISKNANMVEFKLRAHPLPFLISFLSTDIPLTYKVLDNIILSVYINF